MYNLIKIIRWKINDIWFSSFFIYKMFVYKHQSKIFAACIYHSDQEKKTLLDKIAGPINKIIYEKIKKINFKATLLSQQLKLHKTKNPVIDKGKRGKGSVPLVRKNEIKPTGTYFSRIPKTIFDWNEGKK